MAAHDAAVGDVAAAAPRAAPAAAAAPHLSTLRPVALSIPRIDVATSLTRLDLRRDGTVEVPQDPDLAGWYRRGPVPGALGSSVILGHVDSVSGPAVFSRLPQLESGDQLTVTLSDGTTARFRVRSVTTYANADFPAQKVYGRQGHRDLNLVTCGGDYDSTRGGYQANVVIHARLV